MSYRSLCEVVPLMSSGLLRSTSAGRPCRSFSAVARAFANAQSPRYGRNDPWSFGFTPFEDILFSRPILRSTARSMRQMVGQALRRVPCCLDKLRCAYCSGFGVPYLFGQIAENSLANLLQPAVQDEEMSSMLQLLNVRTQQLPSQQTPPAASAPPLGMTVEVKEDSKSLTFLASLPGFSRDDIKVVLVSTCSYAHEVLSSPDTAKSLHTTPRIVRI